MGDPRKTGDALEDPEIPWGLSLKHVKITVARNVKNGNRPGRCGEEKNFAVSEIEPR